MSSNALMPSSPIRTVILTGAGCSADSGLPTYRGPGGVYAGTRDGENALAAARFRADPAAVHGVLDPLREMLEHATPNAAHRAIATFAAAHPDTLVVSQNVDDLLERAGCVNVLHLHGLITHFHCVAARHPAPVRYHRDPAARCAHGRCRSPLRPSVVLFGEDATVGYRALLSALGGLGAPGALLVIGTEGGVVPIGQLLRLIPAWKGLNNLAPSPYLFPGLFDCVRLEPATTGTPVLLAEVERHLATTAVGAGADLARSSREVRTRTARLAQAWRRA
jgi:NAD-dependent deacetylase